MIYRFEVDVKFVVFFVRIQTFDLILKERIGKVIMREWYKCRCTETASGRIDHSRRITNASRTETPIVRINIDTSKHAVSCACVAVESHSRFANIFRVFHCNWSITTKWRYQMGLNTNWVKLLFSNHLQRSVEYIEILVRSLLGGHPSPNDPLTIPQ